MHLKQARFFMIFGLMMLTLLVPAPVASASTIEVSDLLVYDLWVAANERNSKKTFQRFQDVVDSGRIGLVPPVVMSRAIVQMRSSPHASAYRELAYALTAPGSTTVIQEDARPFLAFDALYVAAQKGNGERARILLPYLDDVDAYLFLLADRSFAPVWQQIEERAGDHLNDVFERLAVKAKNAFDSAPRTSENFSALATVLYEAGRNEEVLALVNLWRNTNDEKRKLTEDEGWAYQTEVDALRALGREEEAKAKFAKLAALPDEQYPWVLNFAINRATYLESLGEHEAALDAAKLAARVSRFNGSLTAKMFLARLRTCALHALGKGKQAASDLEFLRENFGNANVGGVRTATEGLLCAGLEAEAEERLEKQLADNPSPLAGYGSLLGDRRFDGIPDADSKSNVPAFILSRPRLRERVLSHSRLIPARFAPIAVLRRIEAD